MKKALLLVLAIVAMCFLLANMDYLNSFVDTLQTGALIPLVVSVVLMLARHLVQAASYDAAFEAVGHATGFWHNVVLIFSLVFINTFCLFSGATGVAFIIDDAHRRGCDAGQSTSGAILSQIGYFAAVFVISVIGFLTMLISGDMNTLFLIGGLALAGVLVGLSSLFVVGHRRPSVLYKLFGFVERAVNKVLRVAKRSLSPGWGEKTATSFKESANILASNPKGTVVCIAYAAFSAILNMACLVAIGYAFGFDNVSALIAAFSVAAISVILSPTPQGVGVVEAAITAILTAAGCSVATAAAIALVYRGIMFWVPFCIGALLLSQSGFFAEKKDASREKKDKDTAWLLGTLVMIVALVNLGIAIIPQTFTPFTVLTDWVNVSGLVAGPMAVVGSLLLLVVAVGLILRYRTAWAVCETMLVLIAGGELLFENTWEAGVAVALLSVWLFVKRRAFDRPIVPGESAPRFAEEYQEQTGRVRAAWKSLAGRRGLSGGESGASPKRDVKAAAAYVGRRARELSQERDRASSQVKALVLVSTSSEAASGAQAPGDGDGSQARIEETAGGKSQAGAKASDKGKFRAGAKGTDGDDGEEAR